MSVGGALGLSPISLLIVSVLLLSFSLAQTTGGWFAYNRRNWEVALGASVITLITFPPAGVVALVFLTLSERMFD